MSKVTKKRLQVLEQTIVPSGNALANDALLWVLTYGLLSYAVILVEHNRLGAVRELVRRAVNAASNDRSDAQIEWSVQRLATNLDDYRDDPGWREQWVTERGRAYVKRRDEEMHIFTERILPIQCDETLVSELIELKKM